MEPGWSRQIYGPSWSRQVHGPSWSTVGKFMEPGWRRPAYGAKLKTVQLIVYENYCTVIWDQSKTKRKKDANSSLTDPATV
jgi:hypothetical protein